MHTAGLVALAATPSIGVSVVDSDGEDHPDDLQALGAFAAAASQGPRPRRSRRTPEENWDIVREAGRTAMDSGGVATAWAAMGMTEDIALELMASVEAQQNRGSIFEEHEGECARTSTCLCFSHACTGGCSLDRACVHGSIWQPPPRP